MKLKGIEVTPSFAPEMPEVLVIKAVDIIDLNRKLNKKFAKWGYGIL